MGAFAHSQRAMDIILAPTQGGSLYKGGGVTFVTVIFWLVLVKGTATKTPLSR